MMTKQIFSGNTPAPGRNRADALGRAFSGKRSQNPHAVNVFSRRQSLVIFVDEARDAQA